MKKFLLSLLVLLSCSLSYAGDDADFFATIDVDSIQTLSLDSVNYKKSYLDEHFPMMGMVTTPQIDLNIRYHPRLKYIVVMCGKVIFEKSDSDIHLKNGNVALKIDSVGLSFLIVSNKKGRTWYTDCKSKNGEATNCKPLRKCPIPYKILKDIRMAFLTTVKNSEYVLSQDISIPSSLSVQYAYKLW